MVGENVCYWVDSIIMLNSIPQVIYTVESDSFVRVDFIVLLLLEAKNLSPCHLYTPSDANITGVFSLR